MTATIFDRSCRSLSDSGCVDVAVELGASSASSTDLQQLYLHGNCFSSHAVEWLSASMLWSGGLQALSRLCLHENDICDRGACVLFETIRRGALPGLSRCDLSSNRVGDHGAEVLGGLLEGSSLSALVE